jgi:hypothetical protein
MADRVPAVASGARSTVAGIVSTRLKVDMDDIYMYESESEDALFKTLSMISKEKAHAKTVAWHADELVPQFVRINGGTLDDTGTTFTVDTPGGSYIPPNFLLENTRTGEQYVTTTGGSATTFVVTARSWGSTAAAATADNDEIMILGPAYAESASLQSAVSTTEVQYTNSIQTVRHNWHISGLLQEISKNGGTYGGEDPAIQRRKTLATHRRTLNRLLLNAEAGTSGGQATMTGLIPFIEANNPGGVNSATTLTEPVFEAHNQTWFDAGESSDRVLLASQAVHGILNQFPSVLQQTKAGQTKHGLRISDYMSAHGDIRIVRERQLRGDKYSKAAVGFDPNRVKLKVVRDTRMIKDRQGVSEDGYMEEVLTDISAIWGAPGTLVYWDSIVA